MLTILLGLLASAAAQTERGDFAFEPSPAEVAIHPLYRLERARVAYESVPLRKTARYEVSLVTFRSPVDSGDAVNDVIHADYFRPNVPGKAPGVVVLHILGADFALSRFMAATLAEHGVAALFMRLPYYGERRDPRSEKRFLSVDAERSMDAMRQGILDVRRSIAWLKSRPEIDPNRLGVTGISLGGIVAASAAGIEPDIRNASLLLAGGGLHHILWDSPEAERYRRLWIESGKTKEDLKKLVAPYDPLTHAKGMSGKRVLMFVGVVDEIVPPSSSIDLWNAAGRPELRRLDCGHYSSAGYFLPIFRETAEFFAKRAD